VIEAVAVVVPAHDEEDLLPGCLAACQAALREAERGAGPLRGQLIVVADACRDRTADRARAAGAAVLGIDARSVGAARAAGFAEALRRSGPGDPGRVWLATTDADTLVPPDWLIRQLGHARDGWDAVVGTVTVRDWTGHAGHVPDRFAAQYRWPGGGPHPHVHGANLGLTAAAYRASGGFRGLATAEDHALVQALEEAGQRVLRTAEVSVVTSARRQARAPFGFGHLLASLE